MVPNSQKLGGTGPSALHDICAHGITQEEMLTAAATTVLALLAPYDLVCRLSYSNVCLDESD